MGTVLTWGNAQFVAVGEVEWTEAEALAFVERVGAIALEEAAKALPCASPANFTNDSEGFER